MHISIAGIALENGKIFIARRLPGGDMGGKWEFPGGKMEDGETCEASLEREFLEEFGVVIRCGALLGESSFEHKGIKRILYAYRIYFTGPPPPAKSDQKMPDNFVLTEHSEWRWASPAEIKNMDFTPSDISLLPFIEPLLYTEK